MDNSRSNTGSNTRQQGGSSRGGATIGFVLSQEQFLVSELIDLGTGAEKAGFGAVWASDHFQPWQENEGHAGLAWVTLAALGQRASRLLMGTGVTCPTYRYRPAIVAEAFASLGILYPGRIFLGVGTGEALNELAAGGGWGDYKERAARLVEALEVIRGLWSGSVVNHKGAYYQVETAKLYDVPSQAVPIYIAAAGPQSLRLAGKDGDGLITDSATVMQPKLMQAFEEGARSAGKDPKSMPLLVEHWVVVGDEQEAARWAPLWRFAPKSWESYVDDPDPRDIQARAEKDVPLHDVYAKWQVSSDPQKHASEMQKLIDNGVTHIFVHSPQADQQSVINFFGQKVLPLLEGKAPA